MIEKVENMATKAQTKAVKKYDEKDTREKLILRVPEGTRKLLTDYVEAKAKQEPDNLKYSTYTGRYYKPSVNAFVLALIEKETGIPMK